MPVQKVTPATGQPADGSNQVTYDSAIAALGYVYVTITQNTLAAEFWQHGEQHTTPFDTVRVTF
jgi:hypothetical protein